jgi:hypothetical protein
MNLDFILPLIGFILTFVLEYLVILGFRRRQPLKLAGYVFLVNLFSWPLAQIATGFAINVWIIEICVVLVESVLLMLLLRMSYWKALLMAFVANLISFLAGAILLGSF